MFWDGLFCFYLLARRTLLVFLGREGSSICITKRFEQQVLFWMFTYFVCLFTFFVFVFSSLFKTFKELEKRLMHCEYHHCISASQSSEWFMICSNIFFLSTAKSVHFWSTSLNLVHPVSSFVLSQFNSHSFKVFSNFSCMFLNPNIFSNLNSNCYFCS